MTSRRRVLGAGVVGTPLLAVPGLSALTPAHATASAATSPVTAEEADGPKPGSYPATPVPPPADRHLADRFSYGVTPALTQALRRAGGGRSWFEQQLRPGTVADPKVSGMAAWWPDLALSPQKLWQRNVEEVRGGWQVMADYQRWLLARRIHSHRQVLEVMSEFWENHLHVPAIGEGWFTWRVPYGALMRKHALGRYADLLGDAILHPAMLIYLDNATSTKEHPNENLGRELLELHTVGAGHYGEADVKNSARILTGWRVDVWNTWKPSYLPGDHWRGRVRVMGFSDANSAADGRSVAHAYLRYLARHPATAQRIARKLAVKFVRDDPPQRLVDRLAQVYREHDTAIAPVLRALVASRDFRDAVGDKLRTPAEDVVHTWRVLDVQAARPASPDDDAGANARLWQAVSLGESPHAWPRPDGAPIDDASWSSPSRALGSFSHHYSMAGAWWPTRRTTYRPDASWLPEKSLRFDDLVDHLSRRLLGRVSTPTLLGACCLAVECRPADTITRDHAVVQWNMHRLLSTVLDSPMGFHR